MISEMRQHFEEHGWVRLETKKKYTLTNLRIASHRSLTGNDMTTTNRYPHSSR